MEPRTKNILIGTVTVLLAAALIAGAVYFNRPRVVAVVDSESVLAGITTDNLMAHLKELEAIAEANGGNRKAGTAGHAASVDYVEQQLKKAGYTTERQQFSYDSSGRKLVSFEMVGPSANSGSVEVGTDVDLMGAFHPDEVTADVTAVDLNLEGDRQTTSGCEASDFEGFPRGNIALVQRGTCRFDVKMSLAAEAGARAVIVMNQGDAADRRGIFVGDLSEIATVPVLAATFDLGAELAAGGRVALTVDSPGAVVTENLIADLPGLGGRTVVVGAHLDGVGGGPGINDNGSGVAAVLETALQLAAVDAQPTLGVRFAFWSGEEDGLYGSTHYVQQLSEAERRAIEVYLNVDMVGSPNPVARVYAGTGSDHPVWEVMRDHLRAQGVTTSTANFDLSDHKPFMEARIRVSGLYTGADEPSPNGAPGDPCYHQACDNVTNIDPEMLGLMADALAHGVLSVAS